MGVVDITEVEVGAVLHNRHGLPPPRHPQVVPAPGRGRGEAQADDQHRDQLRPARLRLHLQAPQRVGRQRHPLLAAGVCGSVHLHRATVGCCREDHQGGQNLPPDPDSCWWRGS